MNTESSAPREPRRNPLQRLFAIVAFVAGGIATELSHPFACTTVPARGPAAERRREERA